MSSLRDELAAKIGWTVESAGAGYAPALQTLRILDCVLPIIERALAAGLAKADEKIRRLELALTAVKEAELAATINECMQIASQWGGTSSPLVNALLRLPHDRSALDDALAQARRQQREKDANKLERMAGEWGDVNGIRDWPMIKEIASAIRAQED